MPKSTFRILQLLIGFFAFTAVPAQVPKKVIVEHFTNTRCSICASKNPGFYANYFSQTGILHLAIHPSSPYANCLLNNHNTVENDARTNYYGLYGSTPKFVIQGEIVPSSTNINAASLFTPYTGQTSPAGVAITTEKFANDSIQCKVVIKTAATHSLGNLKMLVALAEDTILYNAPNGENLHYNVFRKALTAATGNVINLPASVGDSVVYIFSALAHPDWNFSRIYAVVILQEEGNKKVVQSAESGSSPDKPLGVEGNQFSDFRIFPNPASGQVRIESDLELNGEMGIYDITGSIVRHVQLRNESQVMVDVSELERGIYFIRLHSGEFVVVRKLVLN